MLTTNSPGKANPGRPIGAASAKIERPLKAGRMPADVLSRSSEKVLARRVELLRKLAK